MEIKCWYRNDPERYLLDPVLEAGGRKFVFRLMSGDILDPIGGQWFGPNYPKRYIRFNCRLPILPFIAWKWPFIQRAGYLGFKVYSADGNEYPQYKEWMPAKDLGEGSKALCFSFRPFARMEP